MTESRVKVAVRIRPPNKKEEDQPLCVTAHQNCVEVPIKGELKQFSFDHIFGPKTSQEEVFNTLGREVVENARDGFNTCLFAYGQTGCFARGTPIMMKKGTYLPVEEITLGDRLMGDDGTSRTVQKLFRGREMMYKIRANDGSSYTVNENHYLVLRMNEASIIPKQIGEDVFELHFVNEKFEMDKIITSGDLLGKTSNSLKFTTEIKVSEFLELKKEVQERFRLIRRGVEYGCRCLKPIRSPPNGKRRRSLVSFDLPLSKSHCVCDNLEGSALVFGRKFFEALKGGTSLEIPEDTFFGKVIVRHKFVLGAHDRASKSIGNRNERIACFPCNKKTQQGVYQLVYLARSIGYDSSCFKSMDETEIFWVVANIKRRNLSVPLTYFSKFTVEQVGEGDFYGFMLNKNHRFLGENFHVLRNSGKTHTMTGDLGSETQRGLIPRICEALFENRSLTREYTVEISYYEIYSEQIKDLLDPKDEPITAVAIKNSVMIKNLSKKVVNSSAEIVAAVEDGAKNRTVASTAMNNASSRSHAILTIYFRQEMRDKAISAKVNLIDLAGSEKLSDSKVTGIALKQMIAINKSLTQLKTVITVLASKNSHARPDFRSSVLTLILRDSLTGNSKTYFIAAAGPALKHIDATVQTLRFADSAKRVVTKVIENTEDIEHRLQEAKEAEEFDHLIAGKDDAINSLESQLKSQAEEVQLAGELLTKKRQEMRAMELEHSSALMDLAACQSKLNNSLPKEQFEELQSSFDQLQAGFDDLQQKHIALSEERNKLSTECEDAWARNSSLAEQSEQIQAKLTEAGEELEKKRQEILELTEQKADLEAKLEEFEKLVEERTRENEALQKSSQEQQEIAQQELIELRSQLEKASSESKENAEKFSEYKARYEKSESKLRKLFEEQKLRDQEMSVLREEHAKAEEELLEIEDKKKKLDDDLEEMLRVVDELKLENQNVEEAKNAEVGRLQVELEMMKAKETLMLAENEKMMKQVQSSISEEKEKELERASHEREKELLRQLEEMKEELSKAVEDRDSRKKNNEEFLRKERNKLDIRVSKIQKELNTAKKQLALSRESPPEEVKRSEVVEKELSFRGIKKLLEEELEKTTGDLSKKIGLVSNGKRKLRRKIQNLIIMKNEATEELAREEADLIELEEMLMEICDEIQGMGKIIEERQEAMEEVHQNVDIAELNEKLLVAQKLGLDLSAAISGKKN
jgi:hypothetical protein